MSNMSFCGPSLLSIVLQKGHFFVFAYSNSYSSSKKNLPQSGQTLNEISLPIALKYLIGRVGQYFVKSTQ